MRPSHAWPLLMTAIAFGAAGCSGAVQDPGPAADVPVVSSVAAQSCAAKLPPAASIIYKDAEPDVHRETNMESLLRVKVMMLIISDKIRRAEARPAAERAADCLEMLQQ